MPNVSFTTLWCTRALAAALGPEPAVCPVLQLCHAALRHPQNQYTPSFWPAALGPESARWPVVEILLFPAPLPFRRGRARVSGAQGVCTGSRPKLRDQCRLKLSSKGLWPLYAFFWRVEMLLFPAPLLAELLCPLTDISVKPGMEPSSQ